MKGSGMGVTTAYIAAAAVSFWAVWKDVGLKYTLISVPQSRALQRDGSHRWRGLSIGSCRWDPQHCCEDAHKGVMLGNVPTVHPMASLRGI